MERKIVVIQKCIAQHSVSDPVNVYLTIFARTTNEKTQNQHHDHCTNPFGRCEFLDTGDYNPQTRRSLQPSVASLVYASIVHSHFSEPEAHDRYSQTDTIVFCSFDIVSLIVQAVGGAKASMANTFQGAQDVSVSVVFWYLVLRYTLGCSYHAGRNCVPNGYMLHM